ncbi:MAG TPA: SGNH/GDSL hydrolase family protein [Gemmatimonadales bacterium]|nr:SGNH/GDSL hydrolase family protein [Gemmatimonadales bacterium]
MVTLAKIGRWLRDAWFLIGIAAVLFGLLEGGLSLAFLVKHRVSRAEQRRDWRVDADAYPDRSWVMKYYQEFRASDGVRWRPYVYWRRGAYRGAYINVDATGIRRTAGTAPAAPASGRSIRIFMFGGSALWGTGARDEFTIPSILARELESRGLRTEVTNFGESGYVSTQEVIALLLRLQKGDRPDLVIFYDGANDTYSAYQQHVAGLPQNEFNRVTEFNLSGDSARLRAMALRDAAGSLSTVRVLGTMLRKAGMPARPGAKQLVGDDPAADNPPGGSGVAATYFGNLELLSALGDHYHFKSLLYWQPTLFQKTTLTPYEEKERRKAQAFAGFFRETYAIVRQHRPPEKGAAVFHDLSHLFSDVRQPIFIDWIHVGESGNDTIARTMATDVLGAIGTGPALNRQKEKQVPTEKSGDP